MKGLFLSNKNRKWLIRHSLIVFAFSLIIILTGVFYLDLLIANFFNQEHLQKVYYYSREITNIGYSIHYFAISIIGIFFSKIIYPKFSVLKSKISDKSNQLILQWSWFTIRALLLLGILIHLIKALAGRKRPHVFENFDPLSFDSVNFHHHWHSFPSGHAQVLFTVATVALLIWPKHKLLFLGAALFFSLTRVAIHQHYFSDVIAGATVGYLGVQWLYAYLQPQKIRTNI